MKTRMEPTTPTFEGPISTGSATQHLGLVLMPPNGFRSNTDVSFTKNFTRLLLFQKARIYTKTTIRQDPPILMSPPKFGSILNGENRGLGMDFTTPPCFSGSTTHYLSQVSLPPSGFRFPLAIGFREDFQTTFYDLQETS